MASQAASDFLTKEINISNNIVTFRLLSRHLSIHVNDAKRELELYYEASKQSKTPVFATYLLTGISAPQINSAPDVISSQELSEEIPKRLVTLATEDDLEAARGRFADVPFQHIHSLSPVPLKDFGVLTSVSEQVRQLDKQKGQAHAAQLGMLQSEEAPWDGVAIGKPGQKAPIAANPVTKNTTSSKLAEKAQAAKPKVTNTSAQDQAKQPARQGALNFNALTKPKTAAHVSSEDQADDSKGKKPALKSNPSTVGDKGTEQAPKPKAAPKSDLSSTTVQNTSSTTSKVSAPKPTPAASRTTTGRAKRILDSSDEDEPAPTLKPPVTKRQKSYATSEDEDEEPDSASRRSSTSLQAMMDIDDDGVVNGRSTREATPEHVPSARELAAASKAAKAEAAKGVDQKARASRKRVPKGKKRVIKSRRVKNAKGYMITEDYSSYEDDDSNGHNDATNSDIQSETDHGDDVDVDINGKSVSAKPVLKAKPSTGGALAKRQQSESSGGTKKAKQSTTTKPGQPKLASFFGKK